MATIYGQLQDAFSGAADLVLGAESKKRTLRQQDLQADRLAQQIDFANQLQPFALALQRESLASGYLQNVLSHYNLQQLFKTREAENTADAGAIEAIRQLMTRFATLRSKKAGQALSVTGIDENGGNIYAMPDTPPTATPADRATLGDLQYGTGEVVTPGVQLPGPGGVAAPILDTGAAVDPTSGVDPAAGVGAALQDLVAPGGGGFENTLIPFGPDGPNADTAADTAIDAGVVEGEGDADNPPSEGAIEAAAVGGAVFPGLANVAATAQAAQAAQTAAERAKVVQVAQAAAQAKAQAEAAAKAKAAAEKEAQVPESLILRRQMEIMMKSLGPRALSNPNLRQWVPRMAEAMATLELDQEGDDWIKRKTLREESAKARRATMAKIASAGMPMEEFKDILGLMDQGVDPDPTIIDARIKSFLEQKVKTGGLTPANAGAYMAVIPEETRKIVEPLAESYLKSPQYLGLSQAKGFAEAVEVLADYQKSLGGKAEAASDLGLVYNYIKVLDPNSSVMSGEYYTAEKAKGLPDWVANAWQKVSKGTILGPEQREEFRNAARKALKGREAAVASHQRIIEGQLQGLVRPEQMPIIRQRVFGAPMLPVPAARGAAVPGAETGGVPVFNSPEEYMAAMPNLTPGQKVVYMGEPLYFQAPKAQAPAAAAK